MFNVGGPEVLVILLVALIVLGPQQLPKAVRSVGNVMAELRRMSSGFQDEIRNALDVSTETDARREGAALAQRPEDADITETVAWSSEVGADDPDAQPQFAADGDTIATNGSITNGSTADGSMRDAPELPGRADDDHNDWVPSDRASG